MRILPINVGRTNVQNPLDFVTALLVNRHKRGRLRHRGGKLRGGQKYKNKNTNEIWEKSRTSHSDKNGEWKVGLNGRDPIDTKKITIGRSDGKVIKFNGK